MTLDPHLAARLAAARGAPAGTGPDRTSPCPEPGEWAALVEGQVSDAQRPTLEAHLLGCDPCLATLLALESELARPSSLAAPAPPAPESTRPLRPVSLRLLRPALAAAALLLVTVGIYAFASRSTPTTAPTPPLELALARLAQSHPALAASVADLTPDERAALVPPPARGGVRALLPQGLVFGGRPRVRVTPVAGAAAYALRVTDAEGRVVAEARLAAPDAPWPSDLPALAPGHEYVASVEAQGAAGKVRALGAFRTATEAETEAHAAAAATLAAAAPDGPAALLTARRLLRLTAYEAAERELVRALADPQSASDARALRDLLEARIGR